MIYFIFTVNNIFKILQMIHNTEKILMNFTYEKTYRGTIKQYVDGSQQIRSFKFEPSDVGKFIVVKFRYQQNMFNGALFGTQLKVKKHYLSTSEFLYGVYEIGWHSELTKHENNMSYKVKLTPVGNWAAWCPDRSWYTSDIEPLINYTYNLFEDTPIFDNAEQATEFAINKNYELYANVK